MFILARLAGTWEVRLASLIGVKYEVRGAKLFENFGPGIAVFNHQSTLDNCGKLGQTHIQNMFVIL